MKILKKILNYGAITIVALVIILYAAGRIYFHAKLPDVDGDTTVSGIKDKVTITRDTWGIPHIYADSEADAHFGLGYALAQDRLFQMELQRRLARGELSELLGPSLVEADKFFRTYLFRRKAEDYLSAPEKIDPRALTVLDSFIAGVNAFIEKGDLPVEYSLLGAKPRAFTRLDCMSVMGYMAYSFAEGINVDSLYSQLMKKLPGYNIEELFPGYSKEKPMTIMETQAFFRGDSNAVLDSTVTDTADTHSNGIVKRALSLFSGMKKDKTLAQVLDLVPRFRGSNSWTIAPSRSASGHAMLASDPHMDLSNPAILYEAHVKCGTYENYGYYLAILPFPLFGHDRNKAWGITMFENDDCDLYCETFHPKNRSLVKYRGRWVKARIIKETIKVKGGDDVIHQVTVTPHGPVISDFIDEYKGKPVSLFWAFLQRENPMLDALYRASRAENMDDFEKGLSLLTAPGLNFAYADSAGNTAWWAAGTVFIRPAHVNHQNILDGASGRDEILGYLPFSLNPHLKNPASGIIVTANNRSTDRPLGPVKDIKGYWAPSDRAERITQLLSSRKKWDLESMKKVQNDLTPPNAARIINEVASVLEKKDGFISGLSDAELEAWKILKSWDLVADTESIGATVYQFLAYHILRQTLADEMGDVYFKRFLKHHGRWNYIKALVKDNTSRYWDDTATAEKEKRPDILARAFRTAIADLRENYGRNMNKWQWGKIHTVEYAHPIGEQKPMNLIFNIGPFPAPGESRVISYYSYRFSEHKYTVTGQSAKRQLIDFSDLSNCLTVMPTGNSGNVASRHYDDQVELYLKGGYRVINFTDAQIKENTESTLTLNPAPGK